mgnify:CR=1 FL=1|tara:strand:+ start:613 stop:768 length:156 start_codon:yes stop_codon:yes gene_type:complete
MLLRNRKVIFYKLINTDLEVKINFNYASKMWRKNKISIENGEFKYKDNQVD